MARVWRSRWSGQAPPEPRSRKSSSTGRYRPPSRAQSFGSAGQYETLAGRAFGELDPDDPHNAIITDIRLAPRNANGNVEYVASFFLVKPIDMSKSSRLMWHDVPNRGRPGDDPGPRNATFGDIGLSSGWQGDNAGSTVPARGERLRRRSDGEECGRLAGDRSR